MKAYNYIKNDCDQETGKEYSTIVHLITKDDREKALAWRSVSCKMTYHHVSDEKTVQILSLHFITRSVACSLHFVPSRHSLPDLESALCTDRIGIAVFIRASLKSGPKYCGSKRNFSETILAAMIDVRTACWRAPEDKLNDRAMIILYQLKTNVNARLNNMVASDTQAQFFTRDSLIMYSAIFH